MTSLPDERPTVMLDRTAGRLEDGRFCTTVVEVWSKWAPTLRGRSSIR